MVNLIMKTPIHRMLYASMQRWINLKRIASLTLMVPLLAIALVVSLPAVLNAQVNLSLAQPATTVAASGLSNARQIATDAAGNIYSPDNYGRILKITPNGTQSVVAAGLWPIGVAVDGAGNVYATTNANFLVKITPSGGQTMLSSNFGTPTQVAVDGSGNVYVLDLAAGQVDEVSADGFFSVLVSNFPSPSGIAADKEGDVFLTRANSNQVFEGGNGSLRTFPVAGRIVLPAWRWTQVATCSSRTRATIASLSFRREAVSSSPSCPEWPLLPLRWMELAIFSCRT